MWWKAKCSTKATTPANAAINACLKPTEQVSAKSLHHQMNFYPGGSVHRKPPIDLRIIYASSTDFPFCRRRPAGLIGRVYQQAPAHHHAYRQQRRIRSCRQRSAAPRPTRTARHRGQPVRHHRQLPRRRSSRTAFLDVSKLHQQPDFVQTRLYQAQSARRLAECLRTGCPHPQPALLRQTLL